ncbi:MAG TPA: electron transfer flavoprotein subunit beta/FixA family protein [Dehalococcoidia bacterium]|nr:electron transfer flavoprotein subunit beta/FixA family protein [Dehalococcoidia bacterium]
MDIIACIKRVPDTSEADVVKIDPSQKDIEKDRLAFKINDWDEYVLEAAVQLKEKLGGTLTAVTIGPKEWDEVLRRALAMGADSAIRIDQDVSADDPHIVAIILDKVIRRLPYDLVLFGAQSEDFGSGHLGAMVAEILGIPHATLVINLEAEEKKIHVQRELEAGTLQSYTIDLPALLTIHTGINQPRYISMGGIRRAMQKELQVMSLSDLGLSLDALTPMVKLEEMRLPPKGKEAELITGAPEETAGQLAKILKDAGIF